MGRKKIMIVDDEDNILNLVKAILEAENFEVMVAHDGKECLELLKIEEPDLILLDFMMPGMSGVAVSERVRVEPKLKHIKIIYLTALDVSEFERKLLQKNNIVDYIQKPFDNKDLAKRVRKALK
ncbi:MAG: response regulator [Nanoarchaeota archaeon]|nr:response regulator [Nanoarchaeota archaeon]